MLDNSDRFLRDLFAAPDFEFVETLYAMFLGRAADSVGRADYLTKLRSGCGRVRALKDMAVSREAISKALPIPAILQDVVTRGVHPFIVEELLSLNNKAFLALAYRTILHREVDSGGIVFYLRKIEKGVSRLVILRELRVSAEGKDVNADVPGLDRAIRRYKFLQWPVIGNLLFLLGFGKEAISLATSLERIENHFLEFGNTPLAIRLAGQANKDSLFEALAGDKLLAQLAAGDGESTKVTGNVALPAKIMSGEFEVRRILLLRLDHIGDFFVSVRPMVMLRNAWPNAHITLVCGPWNVGLARSLDIFDEIHPYSFFAAKTGEEEFDWNAEDWNARCDGIRSLALGHYDLAIDLRHDSDTRPILSRIDATYRIGFASPGGPLPPTPPLDLFLLEIPAEHRDQLHAETRLVALAALVVETFKPPLDHPIRRLLRGRENFSPPFDGKRPYMVVAPGAGSPNRTWAPENFVALMRRALSEWGMGLVLIGPKGEALVNDRIAAEFDVEDCINLTGGSLTDLPSIIECAALYAGNDTAGGHLAAMLGTPTLSIYAGVSDPRVWQPIGPRVSIAHSQTPCSYCHINLRKDCRHEQRCLSEISTEMAWLELEHLHATHLRGSLAHDGEVPA